MSNIIITADIHFGLAKKLDDILWSVRHIREYAKINDVEIVCVLGDLFHDRENINIEVLNAVYLFLAETKNVYGQQWVLFPGNHDLYMRNTWDINSLHFLNDVATIVEEVKLINILNSRFWIVPFIHFESVYMKIVEAVEELYEDKDVLLTHIGVHNATLNECYMLKNWSTVNFDNSKFDIVFAGHFHCKQKVGDNVWYPGSPIPFRFDEGMVSHGFIEYDLDSRKIKFIDLFELDLIEGPKPPGYITLTDDMLDCDIELDGDNVRIQLNREYSKDELFRIRESFSKRGVSSIKFMKMKEEKIDLDDRQSKSDLSLNSPLDLFDKWLKHDQPKKLNIEFLQKLNEEVVNGNSR